MTHFTSSDGLRLAYRDDGAGLPVLCLAGLTRNMTDFDDLRAQIGAECRLIAMDYRGRGASDHDPDPANYNLLIEGRDALELLDHLGVEQAVIIGTSRGGLIAMLLAATARHRLLGAVLNDVGPRLEPEGLAKINTYIGKPPKGNTYAQIAAALKATTPGMDIDDARWEIAAERWFSLHDGRARLRYDPALADAFIAAMSGDIPETWDLFAALEGLPVAVIHGANSDLLSAATVADMAARLPGLITATVPGRAHVPFLDEPEALAAIRAVLKAAGEATA